MSLFSTKPNDPNAVPEKIKPLLLSGEYPVLVAKLSWEFAVLTNIRLIVMDKSAFKSETMIWSVSFSKISSIGVHTEHFRVPKLVIVGSGLNIELTCFDEKSMMNLYHQLIARIEGWTL